MERDEIRSKELAKLGVELLRFSDHEILTNINGVCEVIQDTLRKKTELPHLSPLPQG
jgi:very-short-patch-repair endonuclease